MDEDIHVIIAEMRKDIANNHKNTLEYRALLCEKIGELKTALIKVGEILAGLPCKEHKEVHKGMKEWAKLQWAAIGAVFTLLAFHLKWQ